MKKKLILLTKIAIIIFMSLAYFILGLSASAMTFYINACIAAAVVSICSYTLLSIGTHAINTKCGADYIISVVWYGIIIPQLIYIVAAVVPKLDVPLDRWLSNFLL